MARIHANGIDIEYEVFGPKTGTPVVSDYGSRRRSSSTPSSRHIQLKS